MFTFIVIITICCVWTVWLIPTKSPQENRGGRLRSKFHSINYYWALTMFGAMRPASLKSMLSSRLCRADILITINQDKVREESYQRCLKSGGVGGSPFEKAQQRFWRETGKGGKSCGSQVPAGPSLPLSSRLDRPEYPLQASWKIQPCPPPPNTSPPPACARCLLCRVSPLIRSLCWNPISFLDFHKKPLTQAFLRCHYYWRGWRDGL